MDYTALYQQKLTTADEAVKVVKSGDWVDYGWCTGYSECSRQDHLELVAHVRH